MTLHEKTCKQLVIIATSSRGPHPHRVCSYCTLGVPACYGGLLACLQLFHIVYFAMSKVYYFLPLLKFLGPCADITTLPRPSLPRPAPKSTGFQLDGPKCLER